MDTVVANVAQHHAVIQLSHPRVGQASRPAKLVGNDVVRVIVGVNQAGAAMRAEVRLPKERLSFRDFREVKWSAHGILPC